MALHCRPDARTCAQSASAQNSKRHDSCSSDYVTFKTEVLLQNTLIQFVGLATQHFHKGGSLL